MTPEIRQRIDYWLQGPFDEETKNQVRQLEKENLPGLIDAFSSDLSFGTGGLRNLMGPGTCRLNIYTIRLATQALANYLKKETLSKPLSVLIGFDSRHHSQAFAEEAARVLAGNAIHVYLLDALRPTPYISFACRFKKADAAIMITASHNPKEYNGYKVYWSDGAQVVPPHDTGIEEALQALQGNLSSVKQAPPNHPQIEKISVATTLDHDYLKAIAPLQQFPQDNQREGKTLKIVYTSLHGTGITLAPSALESWGFPTIHYVDEQIKPDGDFPTVTFPNPEYKEALQMGIDRLKATESDLLIANDPDADRIGIVVRHAGKPALLNGNEIAAICVEYLCHVKTAAKTMPPKAAIVTTIVSTELIKAIAQHYHQTCIEVLTGFKYIGEQIHLWETTSGGYHFLFGAEESYGYLLGTHARDKDAIVSSCLIAEIALHAKRSGKTLIDLLQEIYRNYGVYREKQLSINFNPGLDGMKQMKACMQRLRTHPLKQIDAYSVVYTEDYESRKRTYLSTAKEESLSLPQSDVLLYRLSDDSKLIIRPSGTEPKVKIYASVHSAPGGALEESIKACDTKLNTLLTSLKALLA